MNAAQITTRARLKQLLERSEFDLKLATDAARSLEEFALVKMLGRIRREIEGARQNQKRRGLENGR